MSFSLSEHEDRLVWILGSSRSGSTWLLRMLSSLDGVVGIDDPHLGHHLGVWRPIPLAWSTSEESPELGLLSDVKRDKPDYFFSDRYRDRWMPALRDLIGARFGAQIDASMDDDDDVPLTVVKEPGSQIASWITELFPASRLIFLVRDGRDVVDSWLDAYSADSWGMEEGMYALASHGRLPFIRWQSAVWRYRIDAVQRAYAAHPQDRRILIRYEELLADPARSLWRLCNELQIDCPPDDLDAVASDHSYESVPSEDKGNGREIRSAKPGGWRTNMSREEIEAMEEIMLPALRRMGYAALPDEPQLVPEEEPPVEAPAVGGGPRHGE
jgi:hypothetical protein